MATLSEQISSAISLALSPSPSVPQSQRHDAYVFLSQVKDAHQETWQPCLALFLEHDSDGVAWKWGGQERMFGLQVVGESLPALTPEALAFVQSSLFDYFAREYVSGGAENGVVFLKNATVHLTTLLFFHTYPAASPDFFKPFLSLLRQHPSTTTLPSPPSPVPFNPQTADLFLRLLHEISTEISDVQLRLNKSVQRLAKDAAMRDGVRNNDAPALAGAVWEIIAQALDGIDSAAKDGDKVGLRGQAARELAEMAIRVSGDLVSWIDINLMVTPTSIPLLLRALHLPSPADSAIRSATADALVETITKGMPPADKLSLLTVLDIGAVLARLIDVGRTNGAGEVNSVVEVFREKLAKILNGVGTELCKICDDPAAPADTKVAAMAMATSLLPLLLRFLADAHDDTSSAVFGFATAMLSVYKKEKKRGGADTSASMTPEKRAFLIELLNVTVQKMEYKADAEWTMSIEGEEDDEALQFAEMRKSLRVIDDAIAWIDPELYADAARSIVIATIDTFETGGAAAASLSWQRLELAVFILYGFGQAVGSTGPGAFVVVPASEIQRAKRETEYKLDYTQFPLSQLGEMMLRACRSKLVAYSHPSVPLQFFETVVRYHDFFRLCPEYISEILPSFLDEHGLHQADEAVQARVFYLFSRFIYSAKSLVQAQVSGEVIGNILGRMQDLLNIEAELPSSEPATVEILTKAAGTPTFFDSQLYLFETIGTLISILNQVPDQQVTLLRAVLSPLLAGLQASTRTTATSQEDFVAVLQAHHLIMAVGNVAKGFPDLSARSPVATGQWVVVFKEATEGVLTIAKSMGSFVVIRDAARFSFNRIVATTGAAILPLIPALIDCLIGEITFPELAELMSFLGLLVAKFKLSFVEILDTLLLPVFNRVFYFLKLPITGTDDVIQHSALRRAYFGFILSITTANLQEVLYSEKNKPHLQGVLQSITHYIANDSLAPDQRFGFLVLNKFLTLWVTPYRAPTAPALANGAPPSPVPGFEQFLYTNAVKLCFEVPLKADFDYSDAQSYQVIGEIANLLKALLQKRGPEFVDFMTTSLLPSIQCPPEAGQAFMTALQEAPDGKQFKKFAAEWLRQSRGTPP